MLRPPVHAEPSTGPAGPCLRVAGEVDLAARSLLRDALLRYAADRTGDLIVDLEGVDFIDSAGLAILVDVQNRLHGEGRALELHRVQPHVRKVIDLTGVAAHLKVQAELLAE